MPSGRLGEWLAREPCALHAARRHRVEAAREREDGMTIGCLRLKAVHRSATHRSLAMTALCFGSPTKLQSPRAYLYPYRSYALAHALRLLPADLASYRAASARPSKSSSRSWTEPNALSPVPSAFNGANVATPIDTVRRPSGLAS